MKALVARLYGHYLMPSRLPEYRRIVQRAQGLGYVQLSLRDLVTRLPHERPDCYLVHRHDIDSDVRTARKIFAIEREYGVTASYYFRLSTLDRAFMREIEDYGSEASYHYEEIADYAKRHHLKDAAALRARLDEIRQLFLANARQVGTLLGQTPVTVASHGDFVNRRLNIINCELLSDPAVRAASGVRYDAYDADVLSLFDAYISDRPPPRFYAPCPISQVLGRAKRICLLTHPVQWETNWRENSRMDWRRLIEEFTW
jgi:hypothetical protein